MLDLEQTVEEGIKAEFADAELGDVRRSRRLLRIAERAMEAPAVGFPRMVRDDSELEGVYRLLNNEDVSPEAVLDPHIRACLARMRAVGGPVLVVHDTTDLSFGGLHEREGLGVTHGNQQGFLLHLALAVAPGEARLALGACGMLRLCRTEIKKTRSKSWYEMSKDPERESLRWGQLVEQVEASGDGVERIHLMDREGDIYDLFAQMLRQNCRFVVRGCYDRALADGSRLADVLETLKPSTHREIEINERLDDGKRTTNRRHPIRNARSASVAIAGTRVALRKTPSAQAPEKQVSINCVRVWETSPPDGEPAISWMLYTTEPIETEQQLLAIVDYYRSRWVIEEFFKALKTGCSFEKRQLESYHGLSVALAMFIPIAWRLLLLRSVSRTAPDAPATTVVSEVQLELLRHRLKLPHVPKTAEAATYAVAKLAGHLKRNGAPGWLSLGQGLEILVIMEAGWRAAMAAKTCDQS
jgi:Transposase DNA-binding/Transposase DDE domain